MALSNFACFTKDPSTVLGSVHCRNVPQGRDQVRGLAQSAGSHEFPACVPPARCVVIHVARIRVGTGFGSLPKSVWLMNGGRSCR